MKTVGELFVVEAEEVEQRGVEVVDVDLAYDRAEAKFVCFTVDVPGFHTTTGNPQGGRKPLLHREAPARGPRGPL